ncbi:MAG: patatin family protein [Eubacterium sp.]|nr:patatin family protein [Eubacterium sp.]
MKIGLVLEGGAMRGMYTAGILDILMENNITVDGAIGVSAGATFGCNFKSRQIGRTIRYNMKYSRDPRYAGLRSLIRTGDLYGADFCYKELPNKLDIFDVKTYKKNPMDFYVVTTDINTGKPIYHLCPNGDETDIEWYRASASMPLVSRIVEIDGIQMLDGGISDAIPIHKFREMGYKKNIVILTQHNGYRKKKSNALPIIKLKMGRKYPNLVRDMKIRHKMYNQTLDDLKEMESNGEVYIIQPKAPITIKRTERDPDKLKSLYDIGRKEGMEHLINLKTFLR